MTMPDYSLGRPLPLWPICLLLYVTFSFGAPKSGVPPSLVFAVLIAFWMLQILNFKVHKNFVRLFFFMFSGYFFGIIVAISNSTLELNSSLNLIISSTLFVVVASYTQAWASQPTDSLRCYSNKISLLIIVFFIFSIYEIFNYSNVFEIRNVIHGDLLDYTERDVREFSIMRPTGMYSEPSRFAQAMGIFIALYFLVSRSGAKTFLLTIFAIFLIRSPMIIYSWPLIFIIYNYDYLPDILSEMSGFKKWFMKGLFFVTFITTMIIFIVSQKVRIYEVLLGNDGSFFARIGLPFLYMVNSWEDIWFGSGLTPLSKMYDYINNLFLIGRSELIGTEFRLAIAPTFAFVTGMGIVGSMIFISLTLWHFRWRGFYLLAIFYSCNFLSSGANSVSVMLPMAIVFGITLAVISRQRISRTIASSLPK